MSVTHDIAIAEHVPSEPPDPKALFSRLAAFSARHRRGVIAVWMLVAFAAAPLALTLTGALSGAGWEAQGSTAQRVRDEIRRDFPHARGRSSRRRLPPADRDRGEPGAIESARRAVAARAARARRAEPARTSRRAPGSISRDGHTALIPVDQVVKNDAGRPTAAGELGTYVGKLTLASGAKAKVTGEWPVWSDFNKINAEALHKAELVSGLPTMILLFVAFGMLLAAGLPLDARAGRHRGRVRALARARLVHADVGVVHELLDDDRPRGRHRLQPVHRQPLPRRTRRRRRTRSPRSRTRCRPRARPCSSPRSTVVMALAAVFLVPGHGVPVDGPRHDPVGRRGRPRVADPPPRAARRARRSRPRAQEHRRRRHHRRVPMATLDRRRAAPARPPCSTLGLVVIGALIVPALGMHLGMPGAKVVDKGNTSRDGYDMLVSAFGPGAAAPAFITTPAADAPTVAQIASTVPGVVDARVVTPPAATGRVVVRVTGSTAVDDSRTATLVNTLAFPPLERGTDCAGRRARRAEPRPHRSAGRTRARTPSASSSSSRSCCCSSCSGASWSRSRRS